MIRTIPTLKFLAVAASVLASGACNDKAPETAKTETAKGEPPVAEESKPKEEPPVPEAPEAPPAPIDCVALLSAAEVAEVCKKEVESSIHNLEKGSSFPCVRNYKKVQELLGGPYLFFHLTSPGSLSSATEHYDFNKSWREEESTTSSVDGLGAMAFSYVEKKDATESGLYFVEGQYHVQFSNSDEVICNADDLAKVASMVAKRLKAL